jgi:hypothetical protein
MERTNRRPATEEPDESAMRASPTSDPLLHAKREIEDEAIQLRAQRHLIHEQLRANSSAIHELASRAAGVGIGLSALARLLGISRQMLYEGTSKESRK